MVFPPTYWIVEILRAIKQTNQPKFSSQAFKDALIRRFEKSKFGETLKGIQALIPTYLLTEDHLYILDNKKTPDSNYPMREIVQASSAAPTYFPAVSIGEENYVDGGIGLNNPAFKAYQQARLSYPQQKIILISLGTGITQQPLPDYLKEGGGKYRRWGNFTSRFCLRSPLLICKGIT
ncbi:patatin-like phospholipase family protein [Candidatus Paracaedibacter symbiosus]|uniref:patatin-like phospholipase family protein n=1 Tax=Candidatus Paracaedibacter symbiosus TaxID=244582 RepID=UPI000509C761|nr:patatin-like phospholipase family protein [Candidatus Paracaedibacter symbiosus]